MDHNDPQNEPGMQSFFGSTDFLFHFTNVFELLFLNEVQVVCMTNIALIDVGHTRLIDYFPVIAVSGDW